MSKKTSVVVRRWVVCGAGAMFLAAGQALGVGAAADVLARYPGLKVLREADRPQVFYGVPMNSAADPLTAANQWVTLHSEAFEAGRLSLEYAWHSELSFGRSTVVTYHQRIDGLPVEHGMVKVLVHNGEAEQTVVYAAAKVAPTPATGFAADKASAKQALAAAQVREEFQDLLTWTEPEMVVYMGEGDFPSRITPIRAWKFVGEREDGAASRKFTFFVNAADGSLVHARNEILHIDVVGQVVANATPSPNGNAAADHTGNPPTQRGVPNIRVRINGNNSQSAMTDANGNFVIPWAGTTPVTVDASVNFGQWARVADQTGTPLETASTTATPGVPVTLLLNPTPSEFTTAQLNAFIHQTTTHNFFRDRAPTFTLLDTQLPANTGVSGTCNAFYNGSSTNYYNRGGSCNNTAFSSVVAHEYGHHIVNRLGLAQGAFGEGFGDLMSILQYDDFVVGRFFQQSGAPVRSPATANVLYPCSSAIHTCGMSLGGVVIKMRQAMGTKYGNPAGLEIMRQLTVDWAQLTLGGEGTNSIAPRTAIEFLTANDIDGNLNNGTPDFCEITNAFRLQGVTDVPPKPQPIIFNVVGGVPQTLAPGVQRTLTVNFTPNDGQPINGTGLVYYRRGTTGAFSSAPLNQVSGLTYAATLPAFACGPLPVQFYFQIGTTEGLANYPTEGCNLSSFSADVVSSLETLFADDFEIDRGWAVGPDTATSGNWVRVDPIGTNVNGVPVQPEDDTTPAPGVRAWVTGQGSVGGAAGEADVDNGFTVLTSPILPVNGLANATVQYNRWYSNSRGAAPNADTFRIDVTTNNGSTWTNVETIGPSGPETDGGWITASWTFAQKGITPTSQTRIRFVADDAASASLVEAAIDDFLVLNRVCTDPSPCVGDFNNDGGVDGADVEAFFIAWENADASADINQDGGVDGSDVEAFFNAWEAGC
ncbi:MAG: hypothetical protein KF859_12485 [Phycisphaeraceae bacterium]|nr:hypothetical protein [Phycisphaeraceae bacterium]